MHSDVMKQIKNGIAAHKAYVLWMHNRTISNYEDFLCLMEETKKYIPDPNARF